MKHTTKTVVAGNYYVRESSKRGSSDIGFQASVSFKVGFLNRPRNMYTFASVNDGWTQEFSDKQALCDYLNNDEFGYRQLTKAEYQQQISKTRQGFDPDYPVADAFLMMLEIVKDAARPNGDALTVALMIKAQRFLATQWLPVETMS